MRPHPAYALPLLLLAAACGGQKLPTTALGATVPTTTPGAHQPGAAGQSSTTAAPVHRAGSVSTSTCKTGGLSLRLGAAGAAAGSRYQPIVFTNTSGAACTLTGYPGVSFVAPSSGHQVGAAASRNPQHATTTVTLAPGASASAMLQTADHANYPPADCDATSVSGLRVYPPGNTAAAYVPFAGGPHTACSSQVAQLSVEAVVAGSSG